MTVWRSTTTGRTQVRDDPSLFITPPSIHTSSCTGHHREALQTACVPKLIADQAEIAMRRRLPKALEQLCSQALLNSVREGMSVEVRACVCRCVGTGERCA